MLPAVAGAHVASTTLKFTAVTTKHVTFTRSTFGMQETDVSSTGKTIGFDDVYVTLTGTNTATANVALDVKGGFLYGVVTTTDGGKTFSGKVTRGDRGVQGSDRHDHRQGHQQHEDGDHDHLQLRHGSLMGGGTACAARPSRLLPIKIGRQTNPLPCSLCHLPDPDGLAAAPASRRWPGFRCPNRRKQPNC